MMYVKILYKDLNNYRSKINYHVLNYLYGFGCSSTDRIFK